MSLYNHEVIYTNFKGVDGYWYQSTAINAGIHVAHRVFVHVDLQYRHHGYDGAYRRRRSLSVGAR